MIPYQSISARIEQASDAQRDRQAEILQEAEQLLAGYGVTARARGTIGDPAAEILRIAGEANADIIVVGRRPSHTPHLLGSLTTKLIRGATCDVLVVHLADRTGAASADRPFA